MKLGKFKTGKLKKMGLVMMAAAVLCTGFPVGITQNDVQASSSFSAAEKKEGTGTPDTANLFYSHTISVYDRTVYAIEAGNLTRKTADENDVICTEVLAEDLAGAKYLNVTADAYYAASGGEVLRIEKNSGSRSTIYESDRSIQLLILTSVGDFYTLEDGVIYKNGTRDFAAQEKITLFCPLKDGYLFSTGSVLNDDVFLYRKETGTSFISKAETWYVESDTLVLNSADGNFMISIEDLLQQGELSPFALYGGGDISELLSQAEGDGSGRMEPITPVEDDFNTTILVHTSLSEGQRNCIARARQMAEVEWTALADIPMFQTESTPQQQREYFKAGVTYYGIPYGQPVYNGIFVGPFPNSASSMTVDGFVAETKNPNSRLYTSNANYNSRIMPTYSNDCSSFVSYCWGSDTRYTTSDFKTIGNRGTPYANVGTNVSQLAPGQALNKTGHIILVTDVAYDLERNIAHVTTIEQTPPIVRKRTWGVGGNSGSIADLQAKITSSGYMIIRNLNIDSVGLTEYDSVPLDQAQVINRVSSPISARVSDGAASGVGTVLASDKTFTLEGWSTHKDGCTAFEYQIDRGTWQPLSFLKKRNLYTFHGEVATPSAGSHSVAVRGKTSAGAYYSVAEFTIEVKSSYAAYTTYFDSFFGEKNVGVTGVPYRKTYSINSSAASISYSGWSVSNDGVIQFEYKVDDGLWLPVETGYRWDVYQNGGPIAKNCPAFNSLNGSVDFSDCPNFTHTFSLRGVTDTNGIFPVAEIIIRPGSVSEPRVSELYMRTFPVVREYQIGDVLNTEGLAIVAEYTDRSRKAVYDGFACTYDFSVPGERTVMVSYEGKTVSFSVTVAAPFLYGDVNSDGRISGKDATLLMQHLAGWDVTIDENAADVNGDGRISGKDATLLMQHLAGWNVTLGKQ